LLATETSIKIADIFENSNPSPLTESESKNRTPMNSTMEIEIPWRLCSIELSIHGIQRANFFSPMSLPADR
jgi:hypothetical protein